MEGSPQFLKLHIFEIEICQHFIITYNLLTLEVYLLVNWQHLSFQNWRIYWKTGWNIYIKKLPFRNKWNSDLLFFHSDTNQYFQYHLSSSWVVNLGWPQFIPIGSIPLFINNKYSKISTSSIEIALTPHKSTVECILTMCVWRQYCR